MLLWQLTPGGGSQPLKLAPSLFWPCYHHMPSSGCPLTRGFGGSFREDEPQREGMGCRTGFQWLKASSPASSASALLAQQPPTGCKEAKYQNFLQSVQKFTGPLPLSGNDLRMPRHAISQEQVPSAFSTTSGQ